MAAAARTGITIRNVVPVPTWLSTMMRPPCRSTMPWTIDRPRPDPSPTSLVVKNGSKIFGITSGGMPGPSSATVISTSSAFFWAAMRIVPPLSRVPTAWAAFAIRFMNT